jgi:hypothetical protein
MDELEFEVLKDPCNDRRIKDLPCPPSRELDDSKLYKDRMPNWKLLEKFMTQEGKLTKV